MIPLQVLTVEQLRKVIAIKEQIETLQGEIEAITGGSRPAAPEIPKRRGRKKMSFAERARLGAAARWAQVRAAEGEDAAPMKLRKVSAAGRARMAAAAKARWAKAKAEGKKGQ
jgi:hypothetical protein